MSVFSSFNPPGYRPPPDQSNLDPSNTQQLVDAIDSFSHNKAALSQKVKSIFKEKTESLIGELMVDPKQRINWRKIGIRLKQIDPQLFKEMQASIGSIQKIATLLTTDDAEGLDHFTSRLREGLIKATGSSNSSLAFRDLPFHTMATANFHFLKLPDDLAKVRAIPHLEVRIHVLANLINRDKISLEKLNLSKEEMFSIAPYLTFVDCGHLFAKGLKSGEWDDDEIENFEQSCQKAKVLAIFPPLIDTPVKSRAESSPDQDESERTKFQLQNLAENEAVDGSVENLKTPKMTYKCLDALKDKGIPFRYTPFDQEALVENLNPEWLGSCNVLSHSWMYRKLRTQDFQAPVSYEITESHLPHPMVVGDNLKSGLDIPRIQSELKASRLQNRFLTKREIDSETKLTGIDSLLEYLSRDDSYGTLINTGMSFSIQQPEWHACAFVKRGDQCSWYDPNFGELTFEYFTDFSEWFKMEVMEGTLGYIFSETFQQKRIESENGKVFVSDLFSPPEFSEAEREASLPSRDLVDKRNQLGDQIKSIEVNLINDYTLDMYVICDQSLPLKEIEDSPFM